MTVVQADLLDALDTLSSSGVELLDAPLPLVGYTPLELVDYSEAFALFIDVLRDNPPSNIQQLDDIVGEILQDSSNAPTVTFDGTNSDDAVRIELPFAVQTNVSLPLNVDVATLSDLQSGIDGLLALRVDDAADLSSVDDFYNGMYIDIASGSTVTRYRILDYVASPTTFTLDNNTTYAPTSSDTFAVYQNLPGLVGIESSAYLDLGSEVVFDLDLGIDLATPELPSPFLFPATTGLRFETTGLASGNVDQGFQESFTAQAGPVPVLVEDGLARLSGITATDPLSVKVDFSSWSSTRQPLEEISSLLTGGSIIMDGAARLNLPAFVGNSENPIDYLETTVTANAATTSFDASLGSVSDPTGYVVEFRSGALKGERRTVASYSGGTVTLDAALSAAPQVGDLFRLITPFLLKIPDVQDLLIDVEQQDTQSTAFSLVTPDIGVLAADFVPLVQLRAAQPLVNGLDAALGTLQQAIDREIFAASFPIIGDGLLDVPGFLDVDLRRPLLTEYVSLLTSLTTAPSNLEAIELVQQAFVNAFGVGSQRPYLESASSSSSALSDVSVELTEFGQTVPVPLGQAAIAFGRSTVGGKRRVCFDAQRQRRLFSSL